MSYTPDHDHRSALARDIAAQRTGLANEDAQANGQHLKHYARAAKYRDQDRALLRGMTVALTYWLGKPNDMAAAETYIAEQVAAEAKRA